MHFRSNNTGPISSENFPKLNKKINCSGNKLTEIYSIVLLIFENHLYKIKIEKNKIDNLNKLECLALNQIRKINLKGKPFEEKNPDYNIDVSEDQKLSGLGYEKMKREEKRKKKERKKKKQIVAHALFDKYIFLNQK